MDTDLARSNFDNCHLENVTYAGKKMTKFHPQFLELGFSEIVFKVLTHRVI